MAIITFITPQQQEVTVEAFDGSVMEAAFDHGVDGIDADFGGVCSCATCHVHVDPAWIGRTGPAQADERELLELEDAANEYSRLCCQMEVSDELDGLLLRVVGR